MTEGNGNLVMPVGQMGGYGNGGGFGFGDNGAWWLLILLIAMGGWGNGFGFGGNGGGFVGADVQRGFDQSALVSGINGVQNAVVSGFGDVQTALCGGFGTVNSNIANGFAQNEIAANARQLADLNRSFDSQVATMQGFNGLQGQLSQCCCDNRLATVQTQNIVQNEAAATRSTIQGGVQAILDRICADKIDAKNEKIVELNNKINSLEANNYIQNALTAQTQYFLSLYPTTTGAGAAGAARAVAVA